MISPSDSTMATGRGLRGACGDRCSGWGVHRGRPTRTARPASRSAGISAAASPRSASLGGSLARGAQALLEGEGGGGELRAGGGRRSPRRRWGPRAPAPAVRSRRAAGARGGRRSRGAARGDGRAARGRSPPPSVSGGATERTTTRSPAAATTGRSNRSCQCSGASATARAGVSRVPWWMWTRSRSVSRLVQARASASSRAT